MDKALKTKKRSTMNTFVLVMFIILGFYVLSFVLPSGEYTRIDGAVDPDSFHFVEKSFVNLFTEILGRVSTAAASSGTLCFSMLIFGGSVGVISATGAFDRVFDAVISRFGNMTIIIIPVLCYLLGICGAATVFISTAITLVPIMVMLCKKLKLDNAVAVGLAYLGPWIGFMASPINVSTTATAQSIAGIPAFSGFGLRTVMSVIFVSIVAAFMTWYCIRIRRDPSKSVMEGQSIYDLEIGGDEEAGDVRFTWKHGLIFVLFVGGVVFFAIGSKMWGYGPSEMAGIFFIIAIFSNLLVGKSLDDCFKEFVKGGQNMVSTVQIIIICSLITSILSHGLVIDTLVYYISKPLQYMPRALAAVGMFIANAIINIPIPSGSGQANVVMPIMAPLSDVLGITRQTAILAYQYGDSFTNLMNPCNASFVGALAMAGVSFKKWMKFITPLFVIFLIPIVISLVYATVTRWA